ncbi:tRNA glutamyl-Q(34) synthetase GluQRS [Acidipila sp. EB88]|uniref:tRNA glutamyl-Q(34) synthetase GluQRS n=1 Tax=Acidipila sp. EB88 TaxID=2305226 RepID=UPI000F5F3FCB|nr:tRNA glutamyl-Q(34) synthetase GluQRS [Acidipila sp. EB88]RRA48535.1 tRNA glutamyl-Q(34) synthetase GluQRS [Acidipila sp. EB88]
MALPPSSHPYRGRLAPSPTGLLHLGHARTFAVAHQRARAAGGTLLLRIDDLDPHRSRAAFAEAAVEDLRWLGLDWDEAPCRQSERRAYYRGAWERLVLGGWVYPCQCSRRELQQLASAPHETARGASPLPDDEPVYPGTCRPRWQPGENQGAAERQAWCAAGPSGRNWRFRVPDARAIEFADGSFGPQKFIAGEAFGDFAIWRRDDVPSYQLAVVVDDAATGITEVVRGADLLLSTARQLLLYRALGLSAPGWFHCPLMLDRQGERLAKRNDALSIRALREQGYSARRVLEEAGSAPLAR